MIVILLLILFSFSFAQDTLIRWEEEINLSQDTVYNFYPWIECQNQYVHAVWVEMNKSVYYRRSSDGGFTWSTSFILSDTTTVMVYPEIELQENFVHCIWLEQVDNPPYNGRLRYRRSTDNGNSWEDCKTIGPSNGKKGIESIMDTLFVITGLRPPELGLYLVKSTDNGETWSSYKKFSDMFPDYEIGFKIYNEKFHIAFIDLADSVYYMYSTDLGETWSDSLQIAINPDAPKCRNIVANDYGYLFIPWEDNKYSGGALDDVLLRRSPDTGLTWLPEQQITNHHLVDPFSDICCADSDVYLVWAKDGSSQEALQFRASTDMGETWWPIEDLCNNPILTPTITADTTEVHIAWNDNRVAPLEIYYRRGTRLPVGIEETAIRSMPDALRLRVYPNPFSKLITINFGKGHLDRITSSSYGTGRAKGIELKIFDITGKEVTHIKEAGKSVFLWDGRDKRGSLVPAGIYFCEIKDGTKSYFEKIVKLK